MKKISIETIQGEEANELLKSSGLLNAFKQLSDDITVKLTEVGGEVRAVYEGWSSRNGQDEQIGKIITSITTGEIVFVEADVSWLGLVFEGVDPVMFPDPIDRMDREGRREGTGRKGFKLVN